MDAEVATLEAYRGTSDFERTIEIIEDGPPLNYSPTSAAIAGVSRCATAFSGGKDSLVQTGLLTELTPNPVLVATKSPMPPLEDHITPRRRYILDEVQRRRDVTLIEVESDYRGNFDHGFAQELGYRISVNELTDTFLYTASLLAAGVALGATHLFLASEANLHNNIELYGRVVQHSQCMYSGVTLCALNALLRPFGVSYSSLISPLERRQVQTLLLSRYADLCDLQFSCWSVKGDESACSRCLKCLTVSSSILAFGGRPSRIGVNLVSLLNEFRDWRPKTLDQLKQLTFPKDINFGQLDAVIAYEMRGISLRRMAMTIACDEPGRLLTFRAWKALLAYRGLRRRAIARNPAEPPGYRRGFLKFVDPLLSEKVGAIFDQHFPPAEESDYADLIARSESLLNWIIEPLAANQFRVS